MIRRFFSPPVFEKEEDNFRAKFINGFAWMAIVLLAGAMIPYLFRSATDFTVPILSGLILVMIAALYLLRRGNIDASGLAIIVLGWIGLGIQAYTADGVKDVIVITYIALGLLASIVINWRAGGLVILSSIGVIWALALLEVNGFITPRLQDTIGFSRDITFTFIIITVLIYFSTTSLREAIIRANKSEAGLRASNQELQELNQSLEDRVASRTAELELANQRNEKRAKQFEAIAQVARATTTNESLDTLLPRLASLISEQFGFYHAGIFLLDEERKFAVLRAANSEGGKRMLARGHKLQVGQTGMVGYVSATGTPRIALDVGDDAVYFDNPDLPNTRSELALPLQVADEIIGVLDVQSIVSNAFQEEDIETLSTLADQVAIAIQNSRTYQRMEELLEKAQRTSWAYLQNAWQAMQSEETMLGYQVSGEKVKRLTQPLNSVQAAKAVREKATVTESGRNAALLVPIRLRDQVIGVVDIRAPAEHEWDEDEVDIAEAVADRLSLTLETSLLIKATQRRAAKEAKIGEISARIGASINMRNVLQTAVEELGRALPGSEVVIQFESADGENPK